MKNIETFLEYFPLKFWKAQFTQRPYLGRRFILDLIILGLIYVAADWCSNVASWLSPTYQVPPLPDQLFNLLPRIDYLDLTDVFADTALVLGVCLCIYRMLDSFLPAIQFVECLAMAYLLRSSVVAITNMPDPRLDCVKIAQSALITNFSLHRYLLFQLILDVGTLCSRDTRFSSRLVH